MWANRVKFLRDWPLCLPLLSVIGLYGCAASAATVELRGPAAPLSGFTQEAGTSSYDVAMVGVTNISNKSVRLLSASANSTGAIQIEKVSIEKPVRNGQGQPGGLARAPLTSRDGGVVQTIPLSRHPILRADQSSYLVIRVRLSSTPAGGGFTQLSLSYSDGITTQILVLPAKYGICSGAPSANTCWRFKKLAGF